MKSIDPEKTAHQLIAFINDVFRKEGYTNAVIGVSGGIDSAISCTLAVRALGATHIYPVLLPYGKLNNQGTRDAQMMMKWLKIPEEHVRTVDIQPMVDAAVKTIDSAMDEGRRGNIMARMRMKKAAGAATA